MERDKTSNPAFGSQKPPMITFRSPSPAKRRRMLVPPKFPLPRVVFSGPLMSKVPYTRVHVESYSALLGAGRENSRLCRSLARFLKVSPARTSRIFVFSVEAVNPSEKFGRSVAIPGDSVVESGSDRPESPGIAKWDFSTSGGD